MATLAVSPYIGADMAIVSGRRLPGCAELAPLLTLSTPCGLSAGREFVLEWHLSALNGVKRGKEGPCGWVGHLQLAQRSALPHEA